MTTQTLIIADQHLELHPSGVIYWREEATLLISDLHLGKVTHFRKYGAAVPQKAIEQNFEVLEQNLHYFRPRKICFLGDLFHSSMNSEWHRFEEWVKKTEAEFLLISGNHDIISPLKYEALGITQVPELVWGPFLLTHFPEERAGYFNLSGHIHPAVRLRGHGRQSLRLPCFFKNKHQLILPAFGAFTGSHVLEKSEEDEVYAIADAAVIKI
ncbi:putative phosphoesterase [Muriicola jejuensis]|uniref:Ligase-associated DNA damage response endonuclease PdeM n=1 Tax=Muriicola jejuensis TaxID=504488 RepID=A0A6P0U9F8_9FLAO|nr:ligase-associated DNA damage response endonuclease PdeM [Muriicola jejuensis]NER09667.1 ligase-associated DNA damage response endonuclease PdeM [Muriicola jejuensis]SMP06735.1 putative phosphoesterase [Muriicola jejuensis]